MVFASVETGEVHTGPCGSWACDVCSVSNTRAWRKRFRLGLEADDTGEIPKLLTLTSRPGEPRHVSLARLSRRFEYLRTLLARQFPAARLDGYAGVPELTRAGALHFHVVLRGAPFVPQRWWSKAAHRAGFGYVVDVRALGSRSGATAYLSKYLGKQLGSRSWPPHFRRVRFSQGWAVEWVPRGRRTRSGDGPPAVFRLVRIDPPVRQRRTVDDDQARDGPCRSLRSGHV